MDFNVSAEGAQGGDKVGERVMDAFSIKDGRFAVGGQPRHRSDRLTRILAFLNERIGKTI